MIEKEKAEAYDKALERARAINNGKDVDVESGTTICEYIFPELKESEDEKIRKEIISILRNTYWTSNRNRFNELVAWLEKQGDKDKLIQELGEYKVKYTQEVLEKHINSMSNKDDERLRKTTIAFLKDFAEKGYENAVECIDWLEKQGEDKKEINNFDVLPGLYKCIHRMFDGTPNGRLLFEIGNVYKCLSKHDRAEFEVSYGHSVYLEDPVVYKHFIPFKSKVNKFDPNILQPFDKVLVRDTDFQNWSCGLFSHIVVFDYICKYNVGEILYTMCIPYNDETKYLVGTTKEAPKDYRYWEN